MINICHLTQHIISCYGPQNGYRIVTIDSVTSHFTLCVSGTEWQRAQISQRDRATRLVFDILSNTACATVREIALSKASYMQLHVYCAVGCWHGYLPGARCRLAYGSADATATHCLLLQYNPDFFAFLVPAHLGIPGIPGKRAVKRVYVCVCVCVCSLLTYLPGWMTV